jgi:hypothetical protein
MATSAIAKRRKKQMVSHGLSRCCGFISFYLHTAKFRPGKDQAKAKKSITGG